MKTDCLSGRRVIAGTIIIMDGDTIVIGADIVRTLPSPGRVLHSSGSQAVGTTVRTMTSSFLSNYVLSPYYAMLYHSTNSSFRAHCNSNLWLPAPLIKTVMMAKYSISNGCYAINHARPFRHTSASATLYISPPQWLTNTGLRL